MARILIADDDDILADLVQFRLQGAGHEVIVAEDGERAIECIDAEQPDLLILDSMMPIKTGAEVLQHVRASDRWRTLPILMLTARKGSEDIVTALRGGADDYVTKPFMPDELAARVEIMLAKAGNSNRAV